MEIRTMKAKKKCSKSGEIEVFNTELIYSRVMCLLSIRRISLEDVLKYEVPPILLPLFENIGETRALKSKSDLTSRIYEAFQILMLNVVITDDSKQLSATSWPTKSSVRDLGDDLYHLVLSCWTVNVDIYLVFKRYYKYSIKGLRGAQRTDP